MTTKYQEHNVTLTAMQRKSLAKAYSRKQAVNLRLSKVQLTNVGTDKLLLTQQQLNKINNRKSTNTGLDIKLGISQLRKMQAGGLLPFLIPLIPILAGLAKTVLAPLAISAASAAVTHGVNKALGKGIKSQPVSIVIPRKHIQQLEKVVNVLEKRNILPGGSALTIDEHLTQQNGGFILPLISTLLGSLMPNKKKGSGLYLPFEDMASKN